MASPFSQMQLLKFVANGKNDTLAGLLILWVLTIAFLEWCFLGNKFVSDGLHSQKQ
jgi:hypothetical protein